MIKLFLKGLVIGLANIIPGVSGGTMMVSMGIYDKLIHCITHLFSKLKENLKFLLPIFIGAGAAILGLTFVITPAFEHFPLPTNLLFIGLIMGGIPAIYQKLKGEDHKVRIRLGYIIAFLIFAAVVIGMGCFSNVQGSSVTLTLGAGSLIKLFLVGIVASATMVIPGVSGSMMLLLLGYYNPILDTIKAFVEAVFAWEWSAIWQNALILVPFAIGVVLGIFLIAKIVELLFHRFPFHSYWAILGLVVASPVAILMASSLGVITVWAVLASVVTFAIGFVISMKLGD